MKVVYVAGPYRAFTAIEIKANIRQADQMGEDVARLGAMPLVPHKNTEHYEGVQNDQWFLDGTRELMSRCDALMICPNYESSVGTKGEITEAERLGLPVFYCLAELQAWLSKQS